MLTEEDIKEAQRQSQKSEVVKKLLEFYNKCQQDGVQAFFASLNKQLLAIAEQLDGKTLDISGDDKTFDRFLKMIVDGGKIGENMLNLRRALNGEKPQSEDKEEKSFLDKKADTQRVK